MIVLEQGVVYDGRFASSPLVLRELIGGTDADYDVYSRAHAAARAAASWYQVHPTP